MISKFFTTKNTFDSIVDPVKESIGPYWYLNSVENEHYCWNINLFSDEEIESIITIGKRLESSRSLTGGYGEKCLNYRRSFNSWISPNQHTAWIYQRLTDVVTQNNKKFFDFDISMIEHLQFTYYTSKEEGCYKNHIDPLPWKNPHNRKLSMVLQLSDPWEYEGGELRLHTGCEPITIERRKGMLTTFPSYTLHEVTPVTKGERYSLVAWVHGPAFR